MIAPKIAIAVTGIFKYTLNANPKRDHTPLNDKNKNLFPIPNSAISANNLIEQNPAAARITAKKQSWEVAANFSKRGMERFLSIF